MSALNIPGLADVSPVPCLPIIHHLLHPYSNLSGGSAHIGHVTNQQDVAVIPETKRYLSTDTCCMYLQLSLPNPLPDVEVVHPEGHTLVCSVIVLVSVRDVGVEDVLVEDDGGKEVHVLHQFAHPPPNDAGRVLQPNLNKTFNTVSNIVWTIDQ